VTDHVISDISRHRPHKLKNDHCAMPTTNLSIGREPVLDFECSGWPQEKREELSQAVRAIQGVTSVGGAGVSTMRVRYDPSVINPSALTLSVNRVADEILPGHDFSI
jgi:hypothetical protein